MTMTTKANPRVYVADLAAYNNGRLHGAWIELNEDSTGETVQEQIQQMLNRSPEEFAEEYAFHSYEGFGTYSEEYTSIETLLEIARGIRKRGEIFVQYMEHTGADPEEANKNFEEAYAGEWNSQNAFGENLFEELGYEKQIPEHLRNYIDTESWTRDLFLSGDYFSVICEGATHVIRSM
jgi:antirestriction protein